MSTDKPKDVSLHTRDIVRQLVGYWPPQPGVPTKIESDSELEAHLLARIAVAKSELTDLLAHGKHRDQQIVATKHAIFLVSIGLFASGHMEAVYDIITSVPYVNDHAQRLGGVVNGLLPVTRDFLLPEDCEALLHWLHENTPLLEWDSQNMVYKYK